MKARRVNDHIYYVRHWFKWHVVCQRPNEKVDYFK